MFGKVGKLAVTSKSGLCNGPEGELNAMCVSVSKCDMNVHYPCVSHGRCLP